MGHGATIRPPHARDRLGDMSGNGPISPAILATQSPPVMEARRWIEGLTFSADRPLINLSQAAPMEPPPEGLRRAMADALLNEPAAHIYGPALGLPALRSALAEKWAAEYGGTISTENIAITAGCNMAFASVMNTIAAPGDEVLVPTPWYFNHKMWLDMASVKAVPLPTNSALLPSPETADALLTDRTRAIVLVTPNNPAGVEYPADLLDAFFELARAKGIALIVDETYRDFGSEPATTTDWPHRLFTQPDWGKTFVHLYSFSKAYRMTGHRLGAIVASPERLAEVEKVLDTVQICAPQTAQLGALWGLKNLNPWLAKERLAVHQRLDRVIAGFAELPGWDLAGSGAYFAYVRHPFSSPSSEVAKNLVKETGLLTLPGTMFVPEGDPTGAKFLRFAFANATMDTLDEVFARLSEHQA